MIPQSIVFIITPWGHPPLEIRMLVIDYFFYPHSLVIFFWFIEAAKELKMERKETGIFLNSIFIFGVCDHFVVRNVFLNQKKWACFPFQVFEESQESFRPILNLRVCHVYLCSVGHVQMTLINAGDNVLLKPEALANMYAPTGSKKKGVSIQSRYVKGTEEEFFGVPGSPSFQACIDCTSCPRLPGKLLFLYLSILFHIYFIFSY